MIDKFRVSTRPIASSLALFLVLSGASLSTVQAQSSSPTSETSGSNDVVLDRIRAVVNEGVVLDSEIASATEFYKQQSKSNRQAVPPDNVLSPRILEQLINQRIRQQHARNMGITIDAISVNRAIEQIARNNNMDSLQFRDAIQTQGIDYELFRQNIEQELLMQRLIEREVQPRVKVSQQEIDDYVASIENEAEEQQRYRIQHILVAVPPSAAEEQLAEAQDRAKDILSTLRAGTDFAEVAAASSDGVRALQGGDLGWRTLQELPGFLANALRSLSVGELSEPLRSANGLHIIRLLDKQSDNQTQLSETLARHIFIAGDTPDIEQRLLDARSQLIAGASFAELAAAISDDPNSANNGGELPWFSDGLMPLAMEETAATLKLQEISRPFRTQFGWHLMQVTDRRVRDIDDTVLREQANNALRQGKVEQEIETWSRQLRDESFVDIRN